MSSIINVIRKVIGLIFVLLGVYLFGMFLYGVSPFVVSKSCPDGVLFVYHYFALPISIFFLVPGFFFLFGGDRGWKWIVRMLSAELLSGLLLFIFFFIISLFRCRG